MFLKTRQKFSTLNDIVNCGGFIEFSSGADEAFVHFYNAGRPDFMLKIETFAAAPTSGDAFERRGEAEIWVLSSASLLERCTQRRVQHSARSNARLMSGGGATAKKRKKERERLFHKRLSSGVDGVEVDVGAGDGHYGGGGDDD